VANSENETYKPSFVVAKEVGLTALALAKITSSMYVFSQRDETRYNLGLGLKFEAKGKKVLGYSRKGPKGWEFSSKARDLIAKYVRQFPDFFHNLNRKPRSEIYEVSDLFPLSDGHDQLEDMKKWLKDANVKSLESVPLNCESLSKNIIGKIESHMDEILIKSNSKEIEYSFVAVDRVPRQVYF
jgi:5'-3' exoribonuclease 1